MGFLSSTFVYRDSFLKRWARSFSPEARMSQEGNTRRWSFGSVSILLERRVVDGHREGRVVYAHPECWSHARLEVIRDGRSCKYLSQVEGLHQARFIPRSPIQPFRRILFSTSFCSFFRDVDICHCQSRQTCLLLGFARFLGRSREIESLLVRGPMQQTRLTRLTMAPVNVSKKKVIKNKVFRKGRSEEISGERH